MATLLRHKLNRIIFKSDTRAGKIFDIVLLWLIVFSVLVVLLESVPSISSNYQKELFFLKLGAILAGLGGIIGFITGVLICIGQQQFHWIKLGGQSFIIDYYPVSMQVSDFVFVGIILFIIAVFSGWLPSRNAAKTAYSLKS